MRVYKELSFLGNKPALDTMYSEIYKYFPADWVKPENRFRYMHKSYIFADYIGNSAPHAEVAIYYGEDTWRKGYVQVGNIVPLEKDQLSIEEYNSILDMFYTDIAVPYCEDHEDIKIDGPTSDIFDPLDYITNESLDKLTCFCDLANKSTGSTHPSDEKRWFEFICQTVDDDRVFDFDTLYKFLMDEDYWGKKEPGFLGVMGHFAWSEDKAVELAAEYENYVRIIQYYKESRVK